MKALKDSDPKKTFYTESKRKFYTQSYFNHLEYLDECDPEVMYFTFTDEDELSNKIDRLITQLWYAKNTLKKLINDEKYGKMATETLDKITRLD